MSLVLPQKSHSKAGWSQGGSVAQKLRQEHTCRGQRWHPIGFVEQIQKLPLLILWEETGLCCIDVLEGPA